MVSLRYTHAHGETEELAYDRVIVATGFRFDDSIFAAECRPELVHNGRFPAQTPEWESINVPGLYFAGALTQANDFRGTPRRSSTASATTCGPCSGCCETKHHHRDWPSREIEPTPEGLVEATLARLNRGSSIWQQFGFLHDVIVVDESWDRATYYEEMPLAYIHQSEIGQSNHYYTITLEFGKIEGDPFGIVRTPEPAQGGGERLPPPGDPPLVRAASWSRRSTCSRISSASGRSPRPTSPRCATSSWSSSWRPSTSRTPTSTWRSRSSSPGACCGSSDPGAAGPHHPGLPLPTRERRETSPLKIHGSVEFFSPLPSRERGRG